MTTKTYKYGKHTCKAYKKPAGKGYEVGFKMGPQQIFVGNFIRAKEATTWWKKMNTELYNFSKKYAAVPHAPTAWTYRFLSNYMYKAYYTFLDREFSKYNRGYAHAVRKDERKYSHFAKSHPHPFKHHTPSLRRAV